MLQCAADSHLSPISNLPDTVLMKPPDLSLSARLSRHWNCLPQTGQVFQLSQVFGPETTHLSAFRELIKDSVCLGPDADAVVPLRPLDVICSIDERVYGRMHINLTAENP